MKKKIWWQEFSKLNIIKRAKECDIALMPLGSIEQHGDHLPTGEDTYHAIAIAEKVAEKTGITLLPTPWYGAHPYHHWHFPGTIPLRVETFLDLIEDVIKGASIAGFKKFILLNCHGQEWALPVVVQRLGLEGYFVLAPTLWDIVKPELNEILETPFVHADEAETSLSLAIVPELVDMNEAHDETRTYLIDKKWFTAPSTLPRGQMFGYAVTAYKPEYKQLKYGVVGYPSKGTAKKGKKIIEAAVKYLVELIEEIKEKYPPGVVPEVK